MGKVLLRRIFVLAAVVVVCTLLIVDIDRLPLDPPQVGEIARQTVRAPYTFSYVDEVGLERRRREATEGSLPVFLYDEGLLTTTLSRLQAAFRAAQAAESDPVGAFLADGGVVIGREQLVRLAAAGFPDEAATWVGSVLSEGFGDRLVAADRADLPADGGGLRVVPQVGDRESFLLEDLGRVATVEEVRRATRLAALRDKAPPVWSADAAALAVALVQPNLFFDPTRTSSARLAAAEGVLGEPVTVKRGETLYRTGDRLTPSHVARYGALRAARAERGLVSSWLVIGGFLTVALGGLMIASRPYLREQAEEDRNLAGWGILVVAVAAFARAVVWVSEPIGAVLGDVPPEDLWYLVPVAGAAMIIRLLMGTSRAVVFTLSAGIVIAPLMRLDAVYIIHATLTSLMAAAMAAHMRERIAVLRAGLITGVFGAAFVLVAHLAQAWVGDGLGSVHMPWAACLSAVAGGLLSGIVVLAFVPLFELIGFVTDYRLLELASLNHPVMRQLMLRAPGTYHHSVVVGTLAEAACEAIGANSLQAKVSAYFHDIGKAKQPQYFIENQRGGANRHNDLAPEASARVIIEHVVHGARVAREHRLPKVIIDNILMHHGTGLLQYFFAQAQMASSEPSTVDEAAFRYPGPKPDTREAGVIMLADKVEAATRTIREPTEASVRSMINRIINSVMADDQFSNCPLTFREIYVIADTFTRVLMGIYHQRIEYPQTASISQGVIPAPRKAVVRAELPELADTLSPQVTLEIEGAGLRSLEPLDDDVTDEVTDYESVRNLPHGEGP